MEHIKNYNTWDLERSTRVLKEIEEDSKRQDREFIIISVFFIIMAVVILSTVTIAFIYY